MHASAEDSAGAANAHTRLAKRISLSATAATGSPIAGAIVHLELPDPKRATLASVLAEAKRELQVPEPAAGSPRVLRLFYIFEGLGTDPVPLLIDDDQSLHFALGMTSLFFVCCEALAYVVPPPAMLEEAKALTDHEAEQGGIKGGKDEKEEDPCCLCAECQNCTPRPDFRRQHWACTYRCSCEECEEARSPKADATARLCADFVDKLESIAWPADGDLDALKACTALWQGHLRACVTTRGERGLSSVTYGLRLASFFSWHGMFRDARKLYERFLVPRLLDERRRDELLGAASPEGLAQAALLYSCACNRLEDYAAGKRACLAALDVMRRLADCGDDDSCVSIVLCELALSCVKLNHRKDACIYIQML